MKRSLLSVVVVFALLIGGSVNAQYKMGSAFVKSKAQLTASTPGQAQTPKNGRVMITHSNAQDIIQGTVACSDTATGYTTDNHFLREFDLLGDFQISGAFHINSIEFGVENAVSNTGTGQPVSIDMYTTMGSLNFADMNMIGALDTVLPDMTLGVWSVPVDVVVPHGMILVVDVNAPDGQTVGHTFFAGSNNLGQTAPSYIASTGCGISDPTSFSTIGYPNIHLVINVYGDVSTGIEENTLEMHTWPNPVLDVFNVALPGGEWDVRISDLNGRLVYQSLSNGKTSIDLSQLNNGLYLFQAAQGENVYRQKLMVK